MLSSRLNEIYQQLEAMEADKAPAKAAVILAGLGFSPKMQSSPTRSVKKKIPYICIYQAIRFFIMFNLQYFNCNALIKSTGKI